MRLRPAGGRRRSAPDEGAVYRRTVRKLAAAGELIAAQVSHDDEGLIIVLDLSGFGEVNERYGSALGDALLQRVESSLIHAVADRGNACALGGDQFVVVQPGAHEAAPAAAAALRAVQRASVRGPLGKKVRVMATAGLARWPEHGQTGGDVLAAADRAQRVAKSMNADEGWAEVP